MKRDDLDIEAMIRKINQSQKYRDAALPYQTLHELIVTEARHYKKEHEIIKAVRKKLHQIYAPYLGNPDHEDAQARLTAAFATGNPDDVRSACAAILSTHVSTRERLGIYEQFYEQIFALTGPPTTILDVACGLNPFSFPWMGLPTSTRYHTYDLHHERVGLLNHYFQLQGLAPLAAIQDVLVEPPTAAGDVGFVLKEVHRWEQRQRGLSLRLLAALPVRYLVVSLPRKNMTGRRDLGAQHRALFYNIIRPTTWQTAELEVGGELIFCVDKGRDSASVSAPALDRD